METTELKNNIKKTAWAKRFKKKAAMDYDRAIQLADAVALCKKMKWRML